ncbi:VC0807 family protein [Streptomyces olivaceoviridis]|uniref:VC0807 family protein n=1 Tax=Streptomyces olivaceoviridis TaxID=1921 RepID=UPI00378B05D8
MADPTGHTGRSGTRGRAGGTGGGAGAGRSDTGGTARSPGAGGTAGAAEVIRVGGAIGRIGSARTTGRLGSTRTLGSAGTGGFRGTDATDGSASAEPARPSGTARGALLSLAVDLVLPLLVYYVARALGAGQASALLLSGAPPALRLLAGAARHRRIDGVDLFFTVLLAAAALVSLIGGGPRVLLFKNAALSLAVGGWALGTAFTGRPLAFQVGQRLHRGGAARARDRIWQGSAPFRRALRVLTALWGAEQLLDGALGSAAAATLPTDTVPLLDRALSLLLLVLTAGATAVYTRRFRIRHALPLFGTPAPATVHRGSPSPASPRPS